MDTNWVIARQPDNAVPVVGQEYEIRDSRKGTFCGKILNVHGEFADVEVTEGSPKFRSLDFKLQYSGYVSIRAGLVYLIELEPANTACTRQGEGSRQNDLFATGNGTVSSDGTTLAPCG